MSTVGDEIRALQRAHGPLLPPEIALDWAKRHTKSALHRVIDWNDQTAGHQWRLWQMRQLIAVHVVNDEGVREMVSLSIDRTSPGGGYRHINDVMATPALREILLKDALAELERVRLRYGQLTQLARVWEAIEQAQRQQAKPRRGRTGRAKPDDAERGRARPS